jgi:hypothetical protein
VALRAEWHREARTAVGRSLAPFAFGLHPEPAPKRDPGVAECVAYVEPSGECVYRPPGSAPTIPSPIGLVQFGHH